MFWLGFKFALGASLAVLLVLAAYEVLRDYGRCSMRMDAGLSVSGQICGYLHHPR